MLLPLPDQWYILAIADGADRNRPGLYAWEIEGVGVYVGKFKNVSRPTREYGLNVARLLGDRPYRKSKPAGFRRIHRELAEAIRQGRRVTLTILENPPLEAINARERELIGERGTLNGPPRTLSD